MCTMTFILFSPWNFNAYPCYNLEYDNKRIYLFLTVDYIHIFDVVHIRSSTGETFTNDWLCPWKLKQCLKWVHWITLKLITSIPSPQLCSDFWGYNVVYLIINKIYH